MAVQPAATQRADIFAQSLLTSSLSCLHTSCDVIARGIDQSEPRTDPPLTTSRYTVDTWAVALFIDIKYPNTADWNWYWLLTYPDISGSISRYYKYSERRASSELIRRNMNNIYACIRVTRNDWLRVSSHVTRSTAKQWGLNILPHVIWSHPWDWALGRPTWHHMKIGVVTSICDEIISLLVL